MSPIQLASVPPRMEERLHAELSNLQRVTVQKPVAALPRTFILCTANKDKAADLQTIAFAPHAERVRPDLL